MRLLIDTHVLLWSLLEPERLSARAHDVLADPAHEILVSIASLWEIAIKKRTGKLHAEMSLIIDGIAAQDFTRIGLDEAHLQALLGLPFHHRDPFDHLLIAQAIAEDAAFVSEDRNAPAYPVRVVACSDPRPRPGR